MFSQTRPLSFHIEVTDKCNAGCPMCPRTDAMNNCLPDRSRVFNRELKLDLFEKQFTGELLARTEEIIFGGNFGDPLSASQILPIVEYLTGQGTRLAIATNGSLRKPEWWRRFGEAMKRSGSRLELHVDGLADTNHLYRTRTDFARIMENAAAYIETGARAEWHFIIFGHNQHQVEDAWQLSREMGFAAFILIDTVRFKGATYPYRMPDGELRHLELPEVRAADFSFEGGSGAAQRSEAESGVASVPDDSYAINGINCRSAANNKPYIDAAGQVSACCWIGGSEEERGFLAGHDLAPERFSLYHRQLDEILQDEPFASLYADAWQADCLTTCRQKCGMNRTNTRRYF